MWPWNRPNGKLHLLTGDVNATIGLDANGYPTVAFDSADLAVGHSGGLALKEIHAGNQPVTLRGNGVRAPLVISD